MGSRVSESGIVMPPLFRDNFVQAAAAWLPVFLRFYPLALEEQGQRSESRVQGRLEGQRTEVGGQRSAESEVRDHQDGSEPRVADDSLEAAAPSLPDFPRSHRSSGSRSPVVPWEGTPPIGKAKPLINANQNKHLALSRWVNQSDGR